jgi:hypothetical protein
VGGSIIKQFFSGVGSTVEDTVLEEGQQVLWDIIVDGESTSVDDTHVHTGTNSVVKESGVHVVTEGVVTTEGEG